MIDRPPRGLLTTSELKREATRQSTAIPLTLTLCRGRQRRVVGLRSPQGERERPGNILHPNPLPYTTTASRGLGSPQGERETASAIGRTWIPSPKPFAPNSVPSSWRLVRLGSPQEERESTPVLGPREWRGSNEGSGSIPTRQGCRKRQRRLADSAPSPTIRMYGNRRDACSTRPDHRRPQDGKRTYGIPLTRTLSPKGRGNLSTDPAVGRSPGGRRCFNERNGALSCLRHSERGYTRDGGGRPVFRDKIARDFIPVTFPRAWAYSARVMDSGTRSRRAYPQGVRGSEPWMLPRAGRCGCREAANTPHPNPLPQGERESDQERKKGADYPLFLPNEAKCGWRGAAGGFWHGGNRAGCPTILQTNGKRSACPTRGDREGPIYDFAKRTQFAGRMSLQMETCGRIKVRGRAPKGFGVKDWRTTCGRAASRPYHCGRNERPAVSARGYSRDIIWGGRRPMFRSG